MLQGAAVQPVKRTRRKVQGKIIIFLVAKFHASKYKGFQKVSIFVNQDIRTLAVRE